MERLPRSRFEETKNRLIFLHNNRNSDYLFMVSDALGEHAWHLALIDCDKKEELKKKTGTRLDVKDFGKILESGYGVTPTAYDKPNKFIKDLETKLFVFKLQGNNEIYYVLCDTDKKREIAASRTAEEVGRCEKILYSSIDEDPPEALWDVIEKGYFRSTGGRRYINLYNPDEGNKERKQHNSRREELAKRGIKVARRGDVQRVRDFLTEVGNVDWTDENGWTMLHHAAHCGDLNMIRILKDMNADTQVRDKICGRKPIHIAAREGHARAVELFLINSDSVNDMDKSGWTPLHYAAWNGDSNTMRYLISKKAKIGIGDRYLGKKPIHVAVTEGYTDIVGILLENGANIDDADADGRTLLYHSTLVRRFEMAQFLIDRDANVNIAQQGDVKPIHISAEYDHAQMAELLLSHGADIESRSNSEETPLHWAASRGGFNLVQMLVEKGANLNAASAVGKTPFDMAMEIPHFEKASYLAERMFEMFQDQEKYSDALSISEKLLTIQMKNLGHDHPKTLETQHNVALKFYELAKYEEALKLFDVILKKKQGILGLYHFDTLCTKYEKGRVYVAQLELNKAMEIFEEVFKCWQNTLGAGHHRTLSVARDIAFVHVTNREYDEALKICKDIYEKRKLSSGVNDPVTLRALQDVATILVNKGENENALQTLKDVFEKRKERLGVHHPETLIAGIHIKTVGKILEDARGKGTCCIM